MSITNQSTEEREFEYDVALSFAEEDRKFAECVARQLQKRGLVVYYDKDHALKMVGENLYPMLDDIYRNQSRFCVIFISHHYIRKNWTLHELAAAQARALIEKRPYIFYFRFDDTEVPGLSNNVKYFHRGEYDCVQFAQTLADKIKTVRQPATPSPLRPASKPRESYVPKKLSRQFLSEKVRYFFSSKVRSVSAIAAIGVTVVLGFMDKLTPVDILARRIYEKSKITKVTRCSDGTISFSQGGGSCSSHDGVWEYNVDTVIYSRSLEECREEAEAISLLPP